MSDNKCHEMAKYVTIFFVLKSRLALTCLLSTQKDRSWLGTDIAI